MENLHWIDPTSDEWLASLVERLGGTSVLLLATYRPGYQPPWLPHSVATQMALPPLSPRDSLAVRAGGAAGRAAPVAPQQAIVARAAGNPFFVEELTWAAVEHGDHAGALPLPDTIQAVLAARLDRLPQEAKRLLQTAAVIGTEVPVPLLQRDCGAARGRAAAWPGAPPGGGVPLRDTPLPGARLHLQARPDARGGLRQPAPGAAAGAACPIVEALEALAGDRVAEQVERLAHHALRGEVWDKALTYCRQAGEKALARSAHREAVACFEQALRASQRISPRSATSSRRASISASILTRRSCALGDPRRGFDYLREAAALAEELDDQRRLGRISCRHSPLLLAHGRL